MALFDEARIQLRDAFSQWDFSSCFPTDATYTNPKGVVIVRGWPYDILDNILAETNGQMTQPIISIEIGHSMDTFRSLGGVMGGAAPGFTRIGTRVNLSYIVGCWADEQLGGSDMTEALAGQVQGCCFYNRSRLAAFRNLKTTTSREAFEDRPQLWRVDITVEGDAVVSYDEPS